jgi:hypothetical protein
MLISSCALATRDPAERPKRRMQPARETRRIRCQQPTLHTLIEQARE